MCFSNQKWQGCNFNVPLPEKRSCNWMAYLKSQLNRDSVVDVCCGTNSCTNCVRNHIVQHVTEIRAHPGLLLLKLT